MKNISNSHFLLVEEMVRVKMIFLFLILDLNFLLYFLLLLFQFEGNNSIVEENPAFEYEAPESIRDQISQTPNMTPDDVTYSDGDSSGGHSHDSGPPAPSTPVDSNGNAYANGSSFTGGGGGY